VSMFQMDLAVHEGLHPTVAPYDSSGATLPTYVINSTIVKAQ